jgi:malate dehydrogenase (oxaloacetate-decarboxylating)(NADP+)
MTTAEDLAQGSLFPPLKRIRDVSANIGAAVARVARDAGLAGCTVPDDTLAFVRGQMYEPVYRKYV